MYKIELQNIEMKFGDFKALRDINVEFLPGEVHTLLGENGAGKSTLISLIQGINRPTKGLINLIEEEKVRKLKNTVLDSKKNKIYVIPQHFELVNNTTVLDNIILSSIKEQKFFIDRKDAEAKINHIIHEFNIDINVKEQISNLTIGKKQMVEVIRMLWNDSETIILDEPTAVLSKKEIENLFKLINKLRKANKLIIFISHKLDEVRKISDKISILRKGKLINTYENNDKLSVKKLIGDMTNNQFVDKSLVDYSIASKFNKEILKVTDLNVDGHNLRSSLKDVSFTVNAGEVVAIAAIDGNGEETIFESIIGLKKVSSGNIVKNDEDLSRLDISNRYKTGISYIPSDRHHNGLILDLPIFSNLILHTHSDSEYYHGKLFFKYAKGRKMAHQVISDFDVRGSENINAPIKVLSGGNQQKILIARELSRESDLIMLSQPTRGVDVKAIQNIYEIIFDAKKQGKGVLLYTTEIDEIVAIADKVLVVSDGIINKVLVGNKINKDQIMEGLVR